LYFTLNFVCDKPSFTSIQEDAIEGLKKLKIKSWKETAKGRRTWRDPAEKAKTHEVL